jgi:hypothetical protein
LPGAAAANALSRLNFPVSHCAGPLTKCLLDASSLFQQ